METPSRTCRPEILPRWFYVAWGALFFVQGITDLIGSRHDAFGAVQISIGILLVLSLGLKIQVGRRIRRVALVPVCAVAGAVELARGHVAWGSVSLALAVLFTVLLRYEATPPLPPR